MHALVCVCACETVYALTIKLAELSHIFPQCCCLREGLSHLQIRLSKEREGEGWQDAWGYLHHPSLVPVLIKEKRDSSVDPKNLSSHIFLTHPALLSQCRPDCWAHWMTVAACQPRVGKTLSMMSLLHHLRGIPSKLVQLCLYTDRDKVIFLQAKHISHPHLLPPHLHQPVKTRKTIS